MLFLLKKKENIGNRFFEGLNEFLSYYVAVIQLPIALVIILSE
jgi:hypothetical protein